MDRVAVFVDAGYLFAQGSLELCGTRLRRGEVNLDHAAVVATLKVFAEEASSLPLLRVYWYDGSSQGPTPQHIALARQPGIKIRLGIVNSVGKQKGVDSLIITDMITLARNRAMAECVLLSGDEDLRVGVQQAQELGVRVHLLGIKPARGSQSVLLLEEADATYEWSASNLAAFMEWDTRTPSDRQPSSESEPDTSDGDARRPESAAPPNSPQPLDVSRALRSVADSVASEVPKREVSSLVDDIRATGQRPREVDGKLLAKSRGVLGCDLDSHQKSAVREAFMAALQARLLEDEEPAG